MGLALVMSSSYEPDDFQWVVESLTAEFDGELPYEVIVKVVMNSWSGYRQAGSNWTRWDVADDASARLRRLVAARLGQSVNSRVSVVPT